MTVPVSATMTIGPYAYDSGPFSYGFTNSRLPGTNCSPNNGITEFSLAMGSTESPWVNRDGGIFILSYRDLILQDAFPDSPTPIGAVSLDFSKIGPDSHSWWMEGTLTTFQAVDQTAPVPEPGTMTLLGIGLAAALRKARVRSRRC